MTDTLTDPEREALAAYPWALETWEQHTSKEALAESARERDTVYCGQCGFDEEYPCATVRAIRLAARALVALEAAPIALFSSRNVPEKREAWFKRHLDWWQHARALLAGEEEG